MYSFIYDHIGIETCDYKASATHLRRDVCSTSTTCGVQLEYDSGSSTRVQPAKSNMTVIFSATSGEQTTKAGTNRANGEDLSTIIDNSKWRVPP